MNYTADEIITMATALEKHGKESQINMVFEEMAELQKELTKNLRGKDNATQIAEEIGDLEIMLMQMKMLFNITDESYRWRSYKIQRLKERLKSNER